MCDGGHSFFSSLWLDWNKKIHYLSLSYSFNVLSFTVERFLNLTIVKDLSWFFGYNWLHLYLITMWEFIGNSTNRSNVWDDAWNLRLISCVCLCWLLKNTSILFFFSHYTKYNDDVFCTIDITYHLLKIKSALLKTILIFDF